MGTAVLDDQFPDVAILNNAVIKRTSGWDIKNVFFHYDSFEDCAYFGVTCGVAPGQSGSGICGDADGDGDPGSTSEVWMTGIDLPNYSDSERFFMLLDTDNNLICRN